MAKSDTKANQPTNWAPISDSLGWDDVGGRLLANIAWGIYPQRGVLREYVQNAADTYKDLATPSEQHRIIITPTETSISIQDFGKGMGLKGIKDAKKIAVSTKSDYDDRVGFRGIGIWAGLPACKRLVVESTTEDDPYRYRLTFDFEEIMSRLDDNINIKELVDPHFHIERQPHEKKEHYTRVTLQDITEQYRQLLDIEELQRISSQVLPAAIDPSFQHYKSLQKILKSWPSYQECHIFIESPTGRIEAFRQFPASELEEPETVLLKTEDGTELARAWYCRSRRAALRNVQSPANRGFQLRIKNFAVGNVNMFDDEQGHGYTIQDHQTLKTTSRLAWFCGEVHVTNNAIKPNTPRDDLEREQMARFFIEKLRGFYKERIVEAGAYSSFNPYRDALESAKELLEQMKKPQEPKKPINLTEVSEWIEKLSDAPNQSKGTTKDGSQNLFKDLLRRRDFKDECATVIPALRKLVPFGVEASPSAPNPAPTVSNRPTNTAPTDKGKSKQGTPLPARTGVSSGIEGNGSQPQPLAKNNIEELLSEVLTIVEQGIGDDQENLESVQLKIQNAFDKWVSIHAT